MERGAQVICINPLRERGLERFQHPQKLTEMLTNGSAPLNTGFFRLALGGDMALLRGNVGGPGQGLCPVRGHSNVQGDRTMGINERPPPAWLDALEQHFGFSPPWRPGHNTVEAINAMLAGQAVAYYPEINPLVPLDSFGVDSYTPVSKFIPIRLEPAAV